MSVCEWERWEGVAFMRKGMFIRKSMVCSCITYQQEHQIGGIDGYL